MDSKIESSKNNEMTSASEFEFKPIQVEDNGEVAIRFQVDAYNVSFGDSQRFFDKFGKDGEGYVKWLKKLEIADPLSGIHVWNHNEIVGQIELGKFKGDSSVGYVYLYYLIPAARGKGIGNLLDEYACTYFRSLGIKRMRLSVTANNKSAVKFYKRLGWCLIGEDPQCPGVLAMEKSID